MTRGIICAAAVAASVAFVAPAQARMLDPGLSMAAPSMVQDVRYWRHHHWWRHHHRHWDCWWWHGHRRCAWRWW